MSDDNVSQNKRRPIRSFVRREGRLTVAQAHALENLWKIYGLNPAPNELISVEDNTVLEVGFGMGQSLIIQAKNNPDKTYIGIEVHRPGVGSILHNIQKENLSNINIINKDAVEVLNQHIPDNSLSVVQIFFPDPWHKKRHHKRRLIQPEFVKLLHRKLRPNGLMHIATDWENYAEHILGVVNNTGLFTKIDFEHDRPTTKFETRGKKLGHGVWDLLWKAL
ncbi:MAG: tRNA (guanosine(46)-N7)-methyltransferase TrmB [Gammaproteobacteria bacterium]|nr:tRNA (guanosine(46)-N7)-methyltransferase TrmB [Gammaproteobacteria bacterium]